MSQFNLIYFSNESINSQSTQPIRTDRLNELAQLKFKNKKFKKNREIQKKNEERKGEQKNKAFFWFYNDIIQLKKKVLANSARPVSNLFN